MVDPWLMNLSIHFELTDKSNTGMDFSVPVILGVCPSLVKFSMMQRYNDKNRYWNRRASPPYYIDLRIERFGVKNDNEEKYLITVTAYHLRLGNSSFQAGMKKAYL